MDEIQTHRIPLPADYLADDVPVEATEPHAATTRQALLLASAITLFAFGWRLPGLSTLSLWRDEIDAIYFATRPLGDALAMFTGPAQNGPLYFLALRPWFQLMGTSEFALRFPSAWFATLSIPLLWQLGRRLLPAVRPAKNPSVDQSTSQPRLWTNVPMLAALFFAVNPYQLWYGQEGKMYSIACCLALLATHFWLSGIESGGWRPWLGYLITVSLSIYTHLLMVLILPLHAVWFLIAWPHSRAHWRGYAGALAGLTLPYVPMIWWQWRLLVSDVQLTLFEFVPLTAMLRGLILQHGRGVFATGEGLWWLAPIFFLALAGIVLGAGDIGHTERLRLAPVQRWGLLVSWLLLPILFIYLISLRQPIFTERYVLWIAPALMLLIALGVRTVINNAGSIGRPLAALLAIYVIGFWLYVGWEQRTDTLKFDLRATVDYVTSQRAPDEPLILQIPYLNRAFRYYSSDRGKTPLADSDARLGNWIEGPATNNVPEADARAAVDALLSARLDGAQSVWLVLSEASMWDSRQLLDQWLEAHGEMTEQRFFYGVEVRHYALDGEVDGNVDEAGLP